MVSNSLKFGYGFVKVCLYVFEVWVRFFEIWVLFFKFWVCVLIFVINPYKIV